MELDFLQELLDTNEEVSTTRYPIPEQYGPLRQFDREMRCASRGCSSPTFFKVQNIPYCMIHSLRTLNEMLIERGVEK